MKKRYERPSAYIEEFTPNEYVAACGESGKVYNFQCNAGRNDRYGTVYLETNGKAVAYFFIKILKKIVYQYGTKKSQSFRLTL